MSIDPIEEVKYRHTLAIQNLSRAENFYRLKDWAGAIHSSQLAVENFAKALIAVFEIPVWDHDPSNQLLRLKNRLPEEHANRLDELADITGAIAPEHARSTYEEPDKGLTPLDIYTEDNAADSLSKAKRAKDVTEKMLNTLKVFQSKK
ncbi:MAG: HEPN domain-containing protein [Nitrososphaeria archaeon]